DRHTKVFANSGNGQFRTINEDMKKWYFNDLTYYPLSEEKWEALTKSKGLEIQFRSSVPLGLVNQLFMINGEVNGQLKGIERLW
ncbi:transcriptional regulator, partial [Acinetobacter baumannii]